MRFRQYSFLFLCFILLKTSFADGQYSKPGYAYVTGQVKSEKLSGFVEISVFQWCNYTTVSHSFNIDSNGYFFAKVFLFNSTDVNFKYNSSVKSILLSPNDTLQLTIIPTEEYGFIIKSDNLENNLLREYYKFIIENSFGQTEDIYKIKDSKKYKAFRDSIYMVEVERNNVFLQSRDNSTFFIDWVRQGTYLNYINDLLDQIIVNGKIDTSIITLVNSLEYDPTNKVLHQSYTLLTNKLASVFFRGTMNMNLTNNLGTPNFNEVLPLAKLDKLSLIFSEYIENTSYITNDYIRDIIIANKYLQLKNNRSNLKLDSSVVLKELKTDIIKGNFISEFTSDSPQYNHFISSNTYKISEGEVLLNQIKERNLGKIVFLNFWGTWCPPCYNHMLSLEREKNNLKANDVVFIYLCCKSEKSKWEETVNDLGVDGQHYLLNDEQYIFMSKTFNFNGFPTGIIIDRNGDYITPKSHQNAEILIQQINSLR